MRGWNVVALLGCSLALASCDAETPTQQPERPSALAVCQHPAPAPASSGFSSADTLFKVVAAPPLSEEQRHFLSLVEARPTSAEVHVARLADDPASLLQPDRAIVLNVSPTRSFTAVGQRVDTSAPDHMSWAGPIGGEHGWVQLVLTSKGVTGSLTSVPTVGAFTVYRFEPIGGGLHAIVCVDASKFPPDH